jgi:putative oxidoreductase
MEMKMSKFSDLAARILLSAMFFMAGLSKIGAYAGTQGYMESQGVPGFLLPLVIGVEVIAPVLLVVGWQTRYAAIALAGFTAAAAFMFHLNFADQIQSIMFMKNIAITGGLLLLATHGAGELSLDSKLAK